LTGIDWGHALGTAGVVGAGFATAYLTSNIRNDPIGRLRKAYAWAYKRAQEDGDWGVERIIAAMRDRTVPGAYVDAAGSLFERGIDAWQRRLTPRELGREAKNWKLPT